MCINESCELVNTWFWPVPSNGAKRIESFHVFFVFFSTSNERNDFAGAFLTWHSIVLATSIWIERTQNIIIELWISISIKCGKRSLVIYNDLQHTIVCRISLCSTGIGRIYPVWLWYGVRFVQAKSCTNIALNESSFSFFFHFRRNDDWLCLWLVACIAYARAHVCLSCHDSSLIIINVIIIIKGCVNNEKRKKIYKIKEERKTENRNF